MGNHPSHTFLRFSHLPVELRLQVWRDALPDRDAPAFFSLTERDVGVS
jgi:hypothetical protein